MYVHHNTTVVSRIVFVQLKASLVSFFLAQHFLLVYSGSIKIN